MLMKCNILEKIKVSRNQHGMTNSWFIIFVVTFGQLQQWLRHRTLKLFPNSVKVLTMTRIKFNEPHKFYFYYQHTFLKLSWRNQNIFIIRSFVRLSKEITVNIINCIQRDDQEINMLFYYFTIFGTHLLKTSSLFFYF